MRKPSTPNGPLSQALRHTRPARRQDPGVANRTIRAAAQAAPLPCVVSTLIAGILTHDNYFVTGARAWARPQAPMHQAIAGRTHLQECISARSGGFGAGTEAGRLVIPAAQGVSAGATTRIAIGLVTIGHRYGHGDDHVLTKEQFQSCFRCDRPAARCSTCSQHTIDRTGRR